jgi:hypothetical protein
MNAINRYYNTDIQVCAMRHLFPQFRAIKYGQYWIEFVGTLQVKPSFPVYTVSITYLGDFRPIVKIIRPELVEKPPHFYKKSQSLCLYHPKNYRWAKEKLIAKDIVSWTAAWIYFYEVWLDKKKWYGPEAAHNDLLNLNNS